MDLIIIMGTAGLKNNRNFVRQTFVLCPSQSNQQGRYWCGNREYSGQNYGSQREVDRRSSSANRQTLDPNAPIYSSQFARNNRADEVSENGNDKRLEN
jgi:hypothetical protein